MKQIPILIVSGFLGAGKTTCIQKLLRDLGSRQQRVMVVENDFGAVSFDAAVLARQGARIQALTSGCICCSLTGDFLRSLREVLTKADVDFIVIEPSGVAKLSDVLAVCESPALAGRVFVAGAVTVVDGERGMAYLRNFGAFFLDQVAHATALLVNRTEKTADGGAALTAMLREKNPAAPIWKEAEGLAAYLLGLPDLEAEEAAQPATEEAAHPHGAHHHHGTGGLTAVTVTELAPRPAEAWKKEIEALLAEHPGEIIRVKGVVPTRDSWAEVQYSGGAVTTEPSSLTGAALTLIGTELPEGELRTRWQA